MFTYDFLFASQSFNLRLWMADPSLWITDWDLLGVFLSQCSHSMSKSCLFLRQYSLKGPKITFFYINQSSSRFFQSFDDIMYCR